MKTRFSAHVIRIPSVSGVSVTEMGGAIGKACSVWLAAYDVGAGSVLFGDGEF